VKGSPITGIHLGGVPGSQASCAPKAQALGWAGRAAVALGRSYQRYLSILKPSCCRFVPTCSEYAIQAVTKYGLLKGVLLALRRLLRCHPFSAAGEDPLP
jgi:putative membrane protein insertion efficiency factor